jgi:hypothetical protein
MSGELVSPPRLKNPNIPKALNDIVMRAMAPDVTTRYQRASDLLEDVLAARTPSPRRHGQASSLSDPARSSRDGAHGIQSRVRAREGTPPRFCWQCRKPLHARTDRCPFCGEAQ